MKTVLVKLLKQALEVDDWAQVYFFSGALRKGPTFFMVAELKVNWAVAMLQGDELLLSRK